MPSAVRELYRILEDREHRWTVRWLLGTRWVLVHGPSTEAAARDWLDSVKWVRL